MSDIKRMQVRFANYRDLPQILILLQQAHQESEYRLIPPEPNKARKTLAPIINPSYKGACAIVLEREGDIVGVLLGLVDWHWWASYRFATDLLTYCLPKARGRGVQMIRFFIRWAERQGGVSEITLSASTAMVDYRRLEQLYARLGFQRTGMMWTKFLIEEQHDVRGH